MQLTADRLSADTGKTQFQPLKIKAMKITIKLGPIQIIKSQESVLLTDFEIEVEKNVPFSDDLVSIRKLNALLGEQLKKSIREWEVFCAAFENTKTDSAKAADAINKATDALYNAIIEAQKLGFQARISASPFTSHSEEMPGKEEIIKAELILINPIKD